MYDAEAKRAWRVDLLNRGMCPVCRGMRPLEAGKHRCRPCAIRLSAQAAARRVKWKERGVCSHCGGTLAGDGFKTCPRCRESARLRKQ